MKTYFLRKFMNDNFFIGISFQLRKIISLFILDLSLIILAIFGAYFTRYLDLTFLNYDFFEVIIIYSLIFFLVIFFFKLYMYPISSHDQDIFLKIIVFSLLIFFSISYVIFDRSIVPRSLPIVLNAYLFIFLVFSRYLLKKFIIYVDDLYNLKSALIIGTNKDAKILKNILSDQSTYKVKFFFSVTENEIENRLTYIDKVPVINKLDKLLKIIDNNKISKIFFTEFLNEKDLQVIKKKSKQHSIKLDFAYYINNNLADYIFNLNIKSFFDEIFEKDMFKIDLSKQSKIFKDKSILITGGVGTIGNAIYEQIKNLEVKKIHIVDNSEIGIFNLNKKKNKNTKSHLGSINDESFLDQFFKNNKIDIVFHAAAFKHVSIVENNIISAINNNIFGTEKILNYISKYNIEKFILISSDKAVDPLNVMGKTKRVCELLVKQFGKNAKDKQKFFSVRFGNVAGSSGSVIPIFLENIKNNEDLVVNSSQANRFFMSSMEAAYLVTISTNIDAKNGDILFFDMGESINIKLLGEKMLNLFPNSKSKIIVKELDEIEKKSESLNYKNEQILPTSESKIFLAKSPEIKDNFDEVYSEFKENFDKYENGEEDQIIKDLDKCIM